jgi:hypothetical protein
MRRPPFVNGPFRNYFAADNTLRVRRVALNDIPSTAGKN